MVKPAAALTVATALATSGGHQRWPWPNTTLWSPPETSLPCTRASLLVRQGQSMARLTLQEPEQWEVGWGGHCSCWTSVARERILSSRGQAPSYQNTPMAPSSVRAAGTPASRCWLKLQHMLQLGHLTCARHQPPAVLSTRVFLHLVGRHCVRRREANTSGLSSVR